jgi:hypothetical protein
MSKLSDAIRRVTRVEPTPMGFAPLAVKKQPTMLLAAQIAAGAAAPAGADIVFAAPQNAPPPSGNGGSEQPLRGALLDGTGERPDGFDFLVFDADAAPASVLLEEDAGLVMSPPADLSDSLLQALQWLPLDALLVRWEGAVTVRRLLELQRLSGFSRKPLLLVVNDEPQATDLEALREAGVIGIVVDFAGTGAAKRFARLRETIDGLRPRPKRSRNDGGGISTAASFLPVASVSHDHDHDPDDDPDDDE